MTMKESAGDRWRGRKVKEYYQKAQTHIQEHKREYLVGAGGIAGGLAVGLVLNKRPIEIVNQVAPVFSPVFNNSNQQNNIIGPCCKIVQDVETKELWPMIKSLVEELAEEKGRDPEAVRRMLSRHFAGELDNVFGHRYERIATRTTH